MSRVAMCKDIIEWDVATWCRALDHWDGAVDGLQCQGPMSALEIGCRNGGLSVYLAGKGCRVVCSDLDGPADGAPAMHQRLGLGDMISYAVANACDLPFDGGSFHIVAAKSVLGAVGGADRSLGPPRRAVSEILRVLRPGGVFLFAENMAGTRIHRMLRRRFVPWGEAWHYFTQEDLLGLLSGFRDVSVGYHGFLALLGRREWQRTLLHHVDVLLQPAVPRHARYMACGAAVK